MPRTPCSIVPVPLPTLFLLKTTPDPVLSVDVIWLINEPSGVLTLLTPAWSLCDICGCHPGMGFTRPVKIIASKYPHLLIGSILTHFPETWNTYFEFHKNHRARNWIKYHIRVQGKVTPRLSPNLPLHKNLTSLSLSVWHLMCDTRARGSSMSQILCIGLNSFN